MKKEMESTIKELYRVSDLLTQKNDIQNSMYRLDQSQPAKSPNEASKKQIKKQILEARFAIDLDHYQNRRAENLPPRPQIGAPVENPIPQHDAPQDAPKDTKFSALVGVVFYASIALWLISIVLHTKFLEHVFQSVMLISGVWWFIRARNDITTYSEWEKKYSEWEKEYPEWEKKCSDWNKAVDQAVSCEQDEKFYAQCMTYENAFIAFTKDCDAFYETQKEKKIRKEEELHQKCIEERKKCIEERKALAKKKETEREELKKQLEAVEEQLNAVTIIHPDMTYMASDIARILEMGRADTLKEAINLAIEDERKATEEMNRQAEAQRQEAILEQQAQEARRHQMEMEEAERAHNKAMEEETRRNNAAMEREARAHNEAMHRAAQESNRIAEDRDRHAREQSRASARQNEFTASDGHRCQKCKNRFGCSRDIHNCGAFVSER